MIGSYLIPTQFSNHFRINLDPSDPVFDPFHGSNHKLCSVIAAQPTSTGIQCAVQCLSSTPMADQSQSMQCSESTTTWTSISNNTSIRSIHSVSHSAIDVRSRLYTQHAKYAVNTVPAAKHFQHGTYVYSQRGSSQHHKLQHHVLSQ